ncbi:bacterial alpha-L-rhamnosidase domain protein [Aspergillus campestris IBT 28561]|uniref:Bacterial alpha-L-rhamnosidase domain protein n=1 Tax=Aspergillus campestris (strain IBT 28561) TaxID=1392248 RepID=A0A2I1D2U5_ASPC2|nr:bacterial alpha-L-rhamnosidase domain protein [Aspergillus campestris IBT 28561]PKY04195.1 bacterial alpha-L-rhamnosidase domain protein [Aspergillus campestris IBT 28561]
MASSMWLHYVWCLVILAPASLAQKCWRETTCSGPEDSAFPGPWDKYIYAPASRTVESMGVFTLSGANSSEDYTRSIPYTLQGNGSAVVFDFGIEVGGVITLNYTSTSSGALGLAFPEANSWIRERSDTSDDAPGSLDRALYANFTEAGEGSYSVPDKDMRAGFRYMVVFLQADGPTDVSIDGVSLEIAFQPTWSNLRAYQGYFFSDDEMLNRVWYSGAYALQVDDMPAPAVRQSSMVTAGTVTNEPIGSDDTVFVDEIKEDYEVWPGDMGISVLSSFVSTGDLESTKSALQKVYNTQSNSTGAFDEPRGQFNLKGLDIYHLWSMIGTFYYVLYSNDTDFLERNWEGYKSAMSYIYRKVDSTRGLLHLTDTCNQDKLQQVSNNLETQMILYHALETGAQLATWTPNSLTISDKWSKQAEDLKQAINTHYWDDDYGAFKVNTTDTTLYPQRVNSLALIYRLANPARSSRISENLTKNRTPIGAVTPKPSGTLSPFTSTFEIQAHFAAGQPARALDLIRRSCAWYLQPPNQTSIPLSTNPQNNPSKHKDSSPNTPHPPNQPTSLTHTLTKYTLGLSITSPIGLTWKIAPQFGDLHRAEGGFTTPLGKYWVSWETRADGYDLAFAVPSGTRGNLTLPFVREDRRPSIRIDGNDILRGVWWDEWAGTATVVVSGGGGHEVVVRG